MAVKPKAGKNPDPLGVLPKSKSVEETAKREAATKAAHAGLPEVEMQADDLDKLIDQKWGSTEDYLTAKDPMLDCVNRFKADYGPSANGLSFKFFAPQVVGTLGVDNYEKCLDRAGEPYAVGEMWMGMIPTRIAEKRQRIAHDESNNQVMESENRFRENVARLTRDASGLGLKVVETGDRGSDGEPVEAGLNIRRGGDFS